MNLAAEMGKLPEPKTTKRPPHWAYWRNELWHLAQIDAPHNFHKWPPVYHTMLTEHWWPAVMQAEVDYVDLHTDALLSGMNPADAHNLIHQAYHLLRWQDATGQSIADIAFKWGFTHMGRLATDYRNRFGELPSQTLRSC